MRFNESELFAMQAKGLKIHGIGNGQQSNKHPPLTNPSYANRGMSLQHFVNRANDEYLALGLAHIFETGTPAKNVSDGNGGRKLIYVPAVVDHLGSYLGRSIAFDDKATQIDELPAGNVKQHQIEFLLNHQKAGKGLSFLLVGYTEFGRFFVVMIDEYFKIWAGRHGLKLEMAERIGMEVFAGRTCLDYLRAFEINRNVKGA